MLLLDTPRYPVLPRSRHAGRFMAHIACIAWLLPVLFTLSACQGNPTTQSSQTTRTTPTVSIGLAMDTLVIERWETDRNIFVATVNNLNGEVIVQNANSDAIEQENQIRYLIKKKVDVLVIVAIDEAQLRDEVNLAREHGIKVIAYDRMINHPAVDLYISFDTIAVGQMMAQAMVKLHPHGNFMVMNGSKADNNSILLRQGIQDILDKNPDCEVIAEDSATNWSADDAFNKFKKVLSAEHNLDGIFCSNDALAGAAVRAMALYKMAGEVAVTGQDADLDACQRIVEGTQLMTVYKPIDLIAKAAAIAAVALARGEKPDANDQILVNGQAVPYNRLTPVVVDKDNMLAVIIDSGFHDLKDVYRNVPESQWPRTSSVKGD